MSCDHTQLPHRNICVHAVQQMQRSAQPTCFRAAKLAHACSLGFNMLCMCCSLVWGGGAQVNPEGRMRFPFLQWFRDNFTPKLGSGLCAKNRLLLYVMWGSEWRFYVLLLQLVLKNSWYEVCFETKHEKRWAGSWKVGGNQTQILHALWKVWTKLMLFCLRCTCSCRTSAHMFPFELAAVCRQGHYLVMSLT